MRKIFSRTLVAASLAISSIGLANVAHATDAVGIARDFFDDATITTQIKGKYAADEAVRALGIGVETNDGVVQLSGFSRGEREKTRAEELARQVKGVTDVHNDIVIKPSAVPD